MERLYRAIPELPPIAARRVGLFARCAEDAVWKLEITLTGTLNIYFDYKYIVKSIIGPRIFNFVFINQNISSQVLTYR